MIMEYLIYYLLIYKIKSSKINLSIQNISKVAPISFSYLNKFYNSFLQSSNLALSDESTTQINPSVYSK